MSIDLHSTFWTSADYKNLRGNTSGLLWMCNEDRLNGADVNGATFSELGHCMNLILSCFCCCLDCQFIMLLLGRFCITTVILLGSVPR